MEKINEEEYNKIIENLDIELIHLLRDDSSEFEFLNYEVEESIEQNQKVTDIELDSEMNSDSIIQFYPVYEAQYEIFKELEVEEFGTLNVLVVDSGRNAWYATWSRKFAKEKAFFIDLESAKKYAEDNRKQGTVFTIAPTPCIYIKLHGIYIFIMDITFNQPFGRWKTDRQLKSKKTLILEDLYELFRLNSINWNHPIPDETTFDISYVLSNQDLKEIEVTNLNCLKSQSVGVDYYLRWQEIEPDYVETITQNVFDFLKNSLIKKSTRKGRK